MLLPLFFLIGWLANNVVKNTTYGPQPGVGGGPFVPPVVTQTPTGSPTATPTQVPTNTPAPTGNVGVGTTIPL
jgi:hypothetical protein